uniref:DUF19 domain-containing protein n=1 Tax=Ditylenchus dipsaci TaxID=166011 RepID=A0A915EU06_9BILA
MLFFNRKQNFFVLWFLLASFNRALSSSWELYENRVLPRITSYEQPDCCRPEYVKMKDKAGQKSFNWVDLCRDVNQWIQCLENCRDQSEELYTIIHQAYASTLLKCDNLTAFNEAAECFDHYIIVKKDLCSAEKTKLEADKEAMDFDDVAKNNSIKFGVVCSADVALKQCMEKDVRQGCCKDSANLIFRYFELQMTRMQQFYFLTN